MIILEVLNRTEDDDDNNVFSPAVTNMALKYSWERHIRSINITSAGLGAINVFTGYFKLGTRNVGHSFFGVNMRTKVLR